jgi:hypothetical protein
MKKIIVVGFLIFLPIFGFFQHLLLLVNKPTKPCKHGFEPKDVINLKIDPLCRFCDKPLSELEKSFKN